MAAGLALVVACAVSAGAGPAGSATAAAAERNRAAKFATPGPYTVGYTTLRMGDRAVDVWYPASKSAVRGRQKATYEQTTALPDDLKAFLPKSYDTTFTMNAYANVPASRRGPFPLVLYSHGLGANRMASSALTAGVASWGFVVASVDYVERGTVAQLPGQGPPTLDAARDRQLMLASLDRLAKENKRSKSVLADAVDTKRVATAGHSAGGTVAFDALADPRVKVAIGWAPSAPTSTPPEKPTMIIGGANDPGSTPASLMDIYDTLSAPKRFVEIDHTGHNSFTDLCVVTRNGGGIVGYAVAQRLVSDNLAAVLLNGCREAVPTEQVWPVIQHFTVAELRDAFRIGGRGVGLGDAVVSAFPSVGVTYSHRP